jgi:HK97 family phage prohead protease
MKKRTSTRRPPPIPTFGGLEHRTIATTFEAQDAGLEFKLSGYGSVTETWYEMGSSYTETIKRGAFERTLAQNPDVQLLINHEGLPLARTSIPAGRVGSLQLSEDSHGLHFEAQLNRNDADAQTLMRKIRDGLMDECSFAFRVVRQSWNDDHTERTIQEVSLDRGDVSICNYGANPSTLVDARGRGLHRGRRSVDTLQMLRIRNEAGRR